MSPLNTACGMERPMNWMNVLTLGGGLVGFGLAGYLTARTVLALSRPLALLVAALVDVCVLIVYFRAPAD